MQNLSVLSYCAELDWALEKLRGHHHLCFSAKSEPASAATFCSLSPGSHPGLTQRLKTLPHRKHPFPQNSAPRMHQRRESQWGPFITIPPILPPNFRLPGQARVWVRHCSKRTPLHVWQYQGSALRRLGRRMGVGGPQTLLFFFWQIIQKMDNSQKHNQVSNPSVIWQCAC